MYQPLSDNNIQIIKRTMIYFLIGASTLIIALSWNAAFSNFIQKIFPNKSTNIIGHFLYAIILTLVFTLLTILLIDPKYTSNFSFLTPSNIPNNVPNNVNKTSLPKRR